MQPRSIQHWPSVRCRDDTVWFLSQWLHSSALFCDFNSLHPLFASPPQPWWWLVIWKVTRLKNLTSRLSTATRTIFRHCPTLTVLTVKIRGKNKYSKTQQQKFHLWASFYKLQKKTYYPTPYFYPLFFFSQNFLKMKKNNIAAKNQKIISLFEEETWITTWLLT